MEYFEQFKSEHGEDLLTKSKGSGALSNERRSQEGASPSVGDFDSVNGLKEHDESLDGENSDADEDSEEDSEEEMEEDEEIVSHRVDCPNCGETLLWMEGDDYDFSPCACTRFHWEQVGDMEFLPGWDAKGFLIEYLDTEARMEPKKRKPIDRAALQAESLDDVWDRVNPLRVDVVKACTHPELDGIVSFRLQGMGCGPVVHEWIWGLQKPG